MQRFTYSFAAGKAIGDIQSKGIQSKRCRLHRIPCDKILMPPVPKQIDKERTLPHPGTRARPLRGQLGCLIVHADQHI